jgi:hypothetical protein
MPLSASLTRARHNCIARALEASEHPGGITSSDVLAAARNEVNAALSAAQRIDPGGRSNRALRAELERRLWAIACRMEALRAEDRRRVVAQVIALAAIGRAAGRPVLPPARDLRRGAVVRVEPGQPTG